MARFFRDFRVMCWAILFALLTTVWAVPMYCQSTPANPDSAEPKAAEPAPNANQSSQELKPPEAVQVEPSTPATPEELRRAEIEADTKKLFKLAADLRTEVAKTYKDSLSLSVIKKAEEVEKLAKSLKARMNKEAVAAKN